MRQVFRAGVLGRPREIGWGGRQDAGSGWGTHVNPWLIHVNVCQKPLQYCKVISLQLIKINEKKKKKETACLALQVWSLNHGTTREIPLCGCLEWVFPLFVGGSAEFPCGPRLCHCDNQIASHILHTCVGWGFLPGLNHSGATSGSLCH